MAAGHLSTDEQKMAAAQDPTSPAEQLTALARGDHQEARRLVAQNPATPVGVLLELGLEFTEEVFDNPAMTLQLLAEPNLLLQHRAPDLATLLARSERLAPRYEAMLAEHPSRFVLHELATNPATSPGIVCRLIRHRDQNVVALLARSQRLVSQYEPVFMEHPHGAVLLGLAANPATSPGTLARLAEHPDRFVLGELAANPSASPEILARLEEGGVRSVRRGLARNPTVSLASLRGLAADEESWVRVAAAVNPRLPADLHDLLRRAGASKELRRIEKPVPIITPADRAALLVEGPFAHQLLALQPSLTPGELARLCPEGDLAKTPFCVRLALIINPSLPASYIARFARDPDEQTRRKVAVLPEITPELSEIFACDPSPLVRAALASNFHVLPAFLVAFARDPSALIREKVASNPVSPPSLLAALALDADPAIRKAVGRNPAADPATRRQLASSDPEPEVRKAVQSALHRPVRPTPEGR